MPYAVPAVEYSIGTGGATGGVPVDHVLLPPRPRGKKEKKIVFPGNHPLMRLYGGVTEISDFVDAIAKALPGQPCKGLPLHQKALCVYRHAPDYRKPGALRDAVYNVLLNEAQDRAVGAFGKQLGKNVARLYRQGYYPNRPFGLSHGGFSWRHH